MKKLIVIQTLLFFLCTTVSVTAQDILQLKVQTLKGDGSFGDENVIYEMVDDSKFYVITDGVRTEQYLEAKILPFEEMEGGVEVTSYNLFKAGEIIYTFGIIDMRHMNSEERLASLKIDIPLLIALQKGEEIDYAKAEIIKGKIAKNKIEEEIEEEIIVENFNVKFQSTLAKEVTFLLKNNQFTIQNDGKSLKTIDLEYISYKEDGNVKLFFYKMKDFEFNYFVIADLRDVDDAKRIEEYEFKTEIVLGFGNTIDDDLSSLQSSEVEIVEGEL